MSTDVVEAAHPAPELYGCLPIDLVKRTRSGTLRPHRHGVAAFGAEKGEAAASLPSLRALQSDFAVPRCRVQSGS